MVQRSEYINWLGCKAYTVQDWFISKRCGADYANSRNNWQSKYLSVLAARSCRIKCSNKGDVSIGRCVHLIVDVARGFVITAFFELGKTKYSDDRTWATHLKIAKRILCFLLDNPFPSECRFISIHNVINANSRSVNSVFDLGKLSDPAHDAYITAVRENVTRTDRYPVPPISSSLLPRPWKVA